MKEWKGKWIVAVSVLHTAAAAAFFGKTHLNMISTGVWGAGDRGPMNAAAAWFLLFGLLALATGMAVSAAERSGQALPKGLGAALLALAIAGVVLMPVSGFWLLFPPAVAMLWPIRRRASAGIVS